MTLDLLPASPQAPIHQPREQESLDICKALPISQADEAGPLASGRVGSRGRVIAHGLLIVLSAFAIFPVAWMYLSSFRPPDQVLSASIFTTHFSLGNYSGAFSMLPFPHLLWNTTAMAASVTIGQLFTGLLAAYAFSRWRFRGDQILFAAVVATWLIPFQITELPNYVFLSHIGLLNSVPGVIVPQLASALSIVLLRQHLRAFPSELLDAARIDGMSSFSTLFRVVVPNLAPALSALAILLFIGTWNEYLWPLLVFHTPNSVLQIAIQGFLTIGATNYGALMAVSGLSCLPIFVLYIVLQRRVVNAFVRSGLR